MCKANVCGNHEKSKRRKRDVPGRSPACLHNPVETAPSLSYFTPYRRCDLDHITGGYQHGAHV